MITGLFGQNGIPGNQVLGNTIGAATATSQTAGNALNGISLVDTSQNIIGTNTSQNIIGGTNGGPAATANFIAGNGFGSFTRTQLFGTGKSNSARQFLIDSYLGIAAGTYDNDLSYRVVLSQSVIANANTGLPVGTQIGADQLILFTTDATGASNETNRVYVEDSDENDPTIPVLNLGLTQGDQYSFQVYTGKFLNTIAPDGTTADDVLLIVTDTTPNQPEKSFAYILQLKFDQAKDALTFNTTPVVGPVSLRALPARSPSGASWGRTRRTATPSH